MKLDSNLATPVYLKTEGFVWPEDKMFYLLSRNGLFLCRNHPWFRSCAPAKTGPSDLLTQEAECDVSYPLIPRVLVEKAVGFFRAVYEKEKWESALILVFNRQTQQVELICPDQEANMSAVHYEIPTLPPHLALIGDFHSHCDFSPTPSYTDEGDELNRPGLHLIAGYLKDKRPGFHCVVVADGQRFEIKSISDVIEGYVSSDPATAPPEWMAKVKHKTYAYSYGGDYGGDYDGYSGGGFSSWFKKKPDKDDKEKIQKALDDFLCWKECPSMEIIRTRLFACTKHCSYNYCEKRAQDFINAWPKKKVKHEQAAA